MHSEISLRPFDASASVASEARAEISPSMECDIESTAVCASTVLGADSRYLESKARGGEEQGRGYSGLVSIRDSSVSSTVCFLNPFPRLSERRRGGGTRRPSVRL